MIVDIVCFGAVIGAQRNWCGVRAEHHSPSWGFADLLGAFWEIDIQGTRTPYRLKERSVHRRLKPERDASRARKRVFLGVHRRMLRLLFVGTPEQIAGRARIPEISAKKGSLRCIVIEYWDIRRISVALSRPLTRPKLK